ncbi:hypothetical protein S7711_05861 [Stachybotrys chartarum IBT 7711]|uniref:HMG box domain-containing protein n=1 Tax=Stachybotrys chartarum (strain CBS 109288 / IBT 7711) TaxID=1280523 RepID=A0A084AKM6_STACB|nr:hypothetical protein S7711_05861 [Stachybotrys chartarum IBT 7711]
MRPNFMTAAMWRDKAPDVPVSFVVSKGENDLIVLVPHDYDLGLVARIAKRFSERIEQPVSVFHDSFREKFRLYPFPPGTEKLLDITLLGIFCFSIDGTSTSTADHIPRPRNSWILFRQEKSKALKAEHQGITASELSSICSEMWKSLTHDEKAEWQAKAQEEERLHKERYPDYRYVTRK